MLSPVGVGKKNLGYCVRNGDEYIFNVFNIEKDLKQKNMYTRNMVLISWFQSMIDQYGKFDKVIIEKQVINNVTCMCLESCLITISKCLLKDVEIIIFDPKNKFKDIKYDSKRKEHKKIVVDMARKIIGENSFFESFPKKDDISDSIVMAFLS